MELLTKVYNRNPSDDRQLPYNTTRMSAALVVLFYTMKLNSKSSINKHEDNQHHKSLYSKMILVILTAAANFHCSRFQLVLIAR